MQFDYEIKRNNANTDELAAIAAEMWDAGAHLVMCYSNPKMGNFKRPMGDKWQQQRHSREEVIAWVEMGNFVGIMEPAASLGISCVDIDKGVEYRTKCVESLGEEPLVAHESSRSAPHKCHLWYYTPVPVGAIKWAGGDIRSKSNHQVLLYNLYAVKDAWDMARSGKAPAVDLNKLEGFIGERSASILDGGEEIERDSRGFPLAEDVARADAAVPLADRHDTMIAKIGRAVAQARTKGELNERFRLITGAHQEAMREEEDRARKASIKAEIANAKVFLEGAWAKKQAVEKYDSAIYAVSQESPDKPTALAAIEAFADELEALCREKGWPTPERVRPDMVANFERLWGKRETRETMQEAADKARDELVDRTNALASSNMKAGDEYTFTVKAEWGTKMSFMEAIEYLGIKFRYNSFTERGDIYIPYPILAKEKGGDTWLQLDDNLKAVISMAAEKHAKAYTSAKKKVLRPVEVGRNKEMLVRDYLFATNSWCPMREYFESLPPWCGEMIIHNSMERGGMRIDAGEFTGAVQAFLWLFVVRNCLYPGSSMREYIVLHGPNDCGKSKFVELALPPHLREYYNGAFSLDGSLKVKLERSIGKALMECGEMGQGGKKDWDAVKQWLTLSDVNGERMAYKEFAKRHKLTATTIFTTNRPELPPSDDAAISRFIWANVLSPATRSTDDRGNEREIVWEHFDLLYDPERPELGTWREQYFAQGLAVVKGSVSATKYKGANGDTIVNEECNPQWLPVGSKRRLVAWNKQAGGTYTTEQSTLIDDICGALGVLDSHYEHDFKTGEEFYQTNDIRSAMYSSRADVPFKSWHEIHKMGDKGTAHHDRMVSDIMATCSEKAIANAMPEVKRRLGMDIERDRKRTPTSDGRVVRGWVVKHKFGSNPVTNG